MAATVERNQVGKREALMDLIAVADAAQTPFMAMARKGPKLTNMQFDWQVDKFDEVKMGGVADGVDTASFEDGAKDRSRLKCYAQQFLRSTMVGNLAQEVSDVAGVPSEMARSLDKKRKELSRDIEAAMCSDQETREEATANSPFLLRGLGKWFLNSAQAVLPVPTAYLTPSASINTTAMASLTQSLFEDVLTSQFDNNGEGDMEATLLAGSALKRAITGFTRFQSSSTNVYGTIRTYNSDLDGGKITNSISAYEGDFGTVTIVPSIFLARDTTTGAASSGTTRRGYLLPMDNVMIRPHTLPKVEQLPNAGGGPRAQIRAVLGLQVGNPLRGGKLAATS